MIDNIDMTVPTAPQYIKDFEQLGFGMFVHYGLYSQLERGEWALHHLKLDKNEYAKLRDSFDPVNMSEIVSIGKRAGCKYICLTTRHHDGFSLYDTCGLNEYDAPHSPAGRDVIREFADECRKQDIVPFFYHTTLDWMHPEFNADFDKYLEYLEQSVELLCTNYGKIGGLWFDGNWSKPDADWHEDRLYSMIRRLQPEAMIINNTGIHRRGEKGNSYIDSVTYECGMPSPIDRRGMKKYVAGEMCETLNYHWGISDDFNYKSASQLIDEICNCRRVGANMLLNIGPSADATLPIMQRALMETIGCWMSLFGEAIYNGRPYISNDGQKDFILTSAKDEKTFYAFKFDIPTHGDNNVTLARFDISKATVFTGFEYNVEQIKWMDNDEKLAFCQNGDELSVNFTGYTYGINHCTRVAKITVK